MRRPACDSVVVPLQARSCFAWQERSIRSGASVGLRDSEWSFGTTARLLVASRGHSNVYARVPVNDPKAHLSPDERELLAHGLDHWGGPAHATDALARVMGFENVEHLHRDGDRIAEQLRTGGALSAADLARALIATEFVFASDYYGAGWDWESVTGFSDEDTLRRLREVQRKLIGVARLPE